MGWRSNLRPASFRKVPFFVDTATFTSGRRVALHEFPDREFGYPEDVGKITRTFTVSGHILGDNYFETKAALIRAVEKAGPGELVHPYYGTLNVQLSSFSINEDTGQGRIAAVNFEFFEAGDNRYPKSVQDKNETLKNRAAQAIAAAKSEFDSKFSVSGLPGFAVQTSRDKIAKLQGLFDNATEGLVTFSDKVSELAFFNRNLVAETDDLLQSPSRLSERLLGSFQLLEDSLQRTRGKNKAITVFTNFGADDLPIQPLTPIREKQIENNKVFNDFIRQVSAAKSAEYAVDTDFVSTQEANEKREEISALIEAQKQGTQNDDIFQAMQSLNAVLIKAVPDVDNDLPNIELFTPKNSTNSLVVVYDLFENKDSEQDLIDRNSIKNPAFIEQGKELEVIDVRRK